MTRNTYLEVRLPLREDPLLLMARLVRSRLFDQYVVYENGAGWSLAGGVLASVRLSGHEAGDLSQVGARLAEVPAAGWRAYGWVKFELGAVLAGADPDGTEALLHLIVPAEEVRCDATHVLVRSLTAERLDLLVDHVRTGNAEARPVPAGRIALPLEDTGTYRAAVAAALVELRGQGMLEKLILSRRVPIPEDVDLVASYVAGRRANTPARSFLLDLGGIQAAGFSPETVAEVTADGHVTTRPLAGTRARTGTAVDDARLRSDLLGDPKEIHEHAISVKLAMEDLGEVCDDTGVSEYMTVLDRGTVQHLASTVTGRLRPGHGPWDAFAALFPAVTATGIPKAQAYPLIRALEGNPRGLYAGAVLTCDADGTLDAALVLRSVFRMGGQCWLQAGAGVVRQSRPDREHEETCEKLRSVAHHLVPADHTAANAESAAAPGGFTTD
ncbi:salicylate synthase [Streptomyces sp. NBC_00091]|uniref:salicylate synthase n=1 Tax=Streptomyces sp. NBC_00091 TaxID=2975648 RepID=UPI002258E978|nr:salicylate synthase [Streptomyces sp. NBC_00091]MCX5377295.1 salicylate synthase [Streptomyces sp. NBC_00091]